MSKRDEDSQADMEVGMTTARDPVWHAGRLLQWGLRPLARPAQEAEYQELVERYFDDGAFRTIVRELADGLGLHVLAFGKRQA